MRSVPARILEEGPVAEGLKLVFEPVILQAKLQVRDSQMAYQVFSPHPTLRHRHPLGSSVRPRGPHWGSSSSSGLLPKSYWAYLRSS